MKIVGVGAGPDLLTEEAIAAIGNARIIYGSKRAIDLAKKHINCPAYEITDYTLNTLPLDAVVLSTGDPNMSGLGKFAKKEDEIIPGISSLQLALSRLHIDIDNLAIISAHSRDINTAKCRMILEIRNGRTVFLLPDSAFGVAEVAEILKSEGLSGKISVCERLGYPDERISTGTTEKPPAVQSQLYCIVISDF